MAIITHATPAGLWERFTPDAFESNIGKMITLNLPGRDATSARVIEAATTADGLMVELTLDVPDDVAALLT